MTVNGFFLVGTLFLIQLSYSIENAIRRPQPIAKVIAAVPSEKMIICDICFLKGRSKIVEV